MKLQHAVAREDLTWLINSLRKIKNKDHWTKLIIMGYSRLRRWIDWQAMKHGAPIVIVDPRTHTLSVLTVIPSLMKTDIEDRDALAVASKHIETL